LLAGPWDTSSWWQLCSPCTYTVPGLCGYVLSQPPNMPGSATSLLESFQRGIIRTPEKLSQKHQQQWDARTFFNSSVIVYCDLIMLWVSVNISEFLVYVVGFV